MPSPGRKPIVSTPLILTAAATLLLGATQRGAAQNMGFTPRDTFFAFDLNENAPAEKDGTFTLYYPTPLIGFGGYAGFDILRIEDVPPNGALPRFWSAVTCHRFGFPLRLAAS